MQKFNTLELQLIDVPASDDYEREYTGLKIIIDGVDFLTRVRQCELPFILSGQRVSLEEKRTWPSVSRHAKRVLSGWSECPGWPSTLIDCRCLCDGCCPLFVTIIRKRSFIRWKNFFWE